MDASSEKAEREVVERLDAAHGAPDERAEQQHLRRAAAGIRGVQTAGRSLRAALERLALRVFAAGAAGVRVRGERLRVVGAAAAPGGGLEALLAAAWAALLSKAPCRTPLAAPGGVGDTRLAPVSHPFVGDRPVGDRPVGDTRHDLQDGHPPTENDDLQDTQLLEDFPAVTASLAALLEAPRLGRPLAAASLPAASRALAIRLHAAVTLSSSPAAAAIASAATSLISIVSQLPSNILSNDGNHSNDGNNVHGIRNDKIDASVTLLDAALAAACAPLLAPDARVLAGILVATIIANLSSSSLPLLIALATGTHPLNPSDSNPSDYNHQHPNDPSDHTDPSDHNIHLLFDHLNINNENRFDSLLSSSLLNANFDTSIILVNGIIHIAQPDFLARPFSTNHNLPAFILLHNRIIASFNHIIIPRFHVVAFAACTRLFSSITRIGPNYINLIGIHHCSSLILSSFKHILDRWEDSMLVIQHQVRELLIAILKFIHPAKTPLPALEPILDHIVNAALDIDWHRRAKFELLAVIMLHAPTRSSSIASDSLLDRSLAALANPSLVSSVAQLANQIILFNIDQNLSAWAVPLAAALANTDPTIRKFAGEKILPKIAKLRLGCLDHLVDALDLPGFAANPFLLAAQVSTWKVICSHGPGSSNTTSATERQQKMASRINSLLNATANHSDKQLRLDALELLIAGNRFLQDIDSVVLGALRCFISTNLSCEGSDVRQRMFALLGRFLDRIKRAAYALARNIVTTKSRLAYMHKTETTPSDALQSVMDQQHSFESRLDAFKQFTSWMQSFAITSLFPGASYQRAMASTLLLGLLRQTQSAPIDESSDPVLVAQASAVFAPPVSIASARILFSRLAHDTDDDVRTRIINFLSTSPETLDEIDSETFARETMSRALTLIRSVRAVDVDCGVFLIWFVVKHHGLRLGLPIVFPSIETNYHLGSVVKMSSTASALAGLSAVLEQHLLVAEDNLLVSSESYPLNGVLAAIVKVIEQLDTDATGDRVNDRDDGTLDWTQLIDTIIDQCFRACQCALAVCANASPEGNLPASFQETQETIVGMIRRSGGGDGGDNHGATQTDAAAQLILRHCFRTVKESATVLETMVCRFKLPQSSTDTQTPLSVSRIASIGDLMCVLLTRIRHRGAFAAAHASFASVARRLLVTTSSSSELSALPKQWLDDFLSQVNRVQVSVTRRSAGLPYAVLALLTPPSPLQDQSLDRTITMLCDVANRAPDTTLNEHIDSTQVHAFNILRTMIQDADLSHRLRHHLGTCFLLCLHHFRSPFFPIRNCSAMLFSVLLHRCVGAPKARGEADVVGTVTPREFFGKFGFVYGKLVHEFGIAVDLLDRNRSNQHGDGNGDNTGVGGSDVHPLLYPVLTVLARIRPGSVTDTTEYPLAPFIRLVRQCARARLWKVREMAARVVSGLVSCRTHAVAILVEDAECVGRCVVVSGEYGGSGNERNLVHGKLMQFRAIVSTHLRVPVTDIGDGLQPSVSMETNTDGSVNVSAVSLFLRDVRAVFDAVCRINIPVLVSTRQYASASIAFDIVSRVVDTVRSIGSHTLELIPAYTDLLTSVRDAAMDMLTRSCSRECQPYLEPVIAIVFRCRDVGVSSLCDDVVQGWVLSRVPEVRRGALESVLRGVVSTTALLSDQLQLTVIDIALVTGTDHGVIDSACVSTATEILVMLVRRRLLSDCARAYVWETCHGVVSRCATRVPVSVVVSHIRVLVTALITAIESCVDERDNYRDGCDRVSAIAMDLVDVADTIRIDDAERPIQYAHVLITELMTVDWTLFLTHASPISIVRVLVLVDVMLTMHSGDVRGMASVLVSKIFASMCVCRGDVESVDGVSAGVGPREARISLWNIIPVYCGTCHVSWTHAITHHLCRPLVADMDIPQSLKQRQETASVLFDHENMNLYAECFGDVVFASRVLVGMVKTVKHGCVMPTSVLRDVESVLRQRVCDSVTHMDLIRSYTQSTLMGSGLDTFGSLSVLLLTSDPCVFGAIARVIACAHVLRDMTVYRYQQDSQQASPDNHDDDTDGVDELLKCVGRLDMHPVLVDFARRGVGSSMSGSVDAVNTGCGVDVCDVVGFVGFS